MPRSPRDPERIIRRLHASASLAFAAIVGAFVFHYRSEGATLGPYSTRYFFGLILPFLALVAVIVHAVVSRPRKRRADSAPRPRRTTLIEAIAGAAALVAGWTWALKVSDEYVSVGVATLVLSAWIALWARRRGSVEPLIAGLVVLGAGSILFAPELPGLFSRSTLVIWGDTTTFATLFPRQAPFIGEGGRLRPGLDVLMRAPEYRGGARLVTDGNGFRNTEPVPRRKEDGEYRILSLGDSFSTGFCADQDSFFGRLLEIDLAARAVPGRRVRVINAEVSDPAYGLYYLQHHGLAWRPDLVVYGLSGNDAMQAEQFLGPDRLFRLVQGRLEANPGFDPNVPSAWDRFESFSYPAAGAPRLRLDSPATLLRMKLSRFRWIGALGGAIASGKYPPADMPGYADAWERLDAHKRLVDGSSNLGFFYRPGGAPIEAMNAALFELLDAMAQASVESGVRFVLVVHPERYQVQRADWDVMATRWSLDPADFDLRLENRRLASFCEARGLSCCDLVEAFDEAAHGEGAGLYLPEGDMHYSRRGHQVAASRAAECVAAAWPAR